MLFILTIWISLAFNEVAASDECRTIEFIPEVKGKVLENHVIRSMYVSNKDVCEISCYGEPNCVSYNYGPTGSDAPVCELNDRTHLQVSSNDFVWQPGYIYRYTENLCQSSPCLNNAKCQAGFTSKGYRCICSSGYQGEHCETAQLTTIEWTVFQGSNYTLVIDADTWYNSDTKCKNDLGGHLVKIKSAEENNFIKTQYLTAQVDYWIGLSDSVNEGVWKWADGTDLTGYTNWGRNQPNNVNDQDCAGIRMGTHFNQYYDAEWHDNKCWNNKGFICEK